MKTVVLTILTFLFAFELSAQKAGNAILFDGDDDGIIVPHHSSLNPDGGSWTICFWIKPLDEEQVAPILMKRDPAHPFNQYLFDIADSDPHNPSDGRRIVANYIDSVGVSERSGYMAEEFVDGNWHHIAFVADKDEDSIFAYIDGISTDFILLYNYGEWPDVGNTRDLHIGNFEMIYFFEGEMDELSIWNKALSVNQVNIVMNDTLSSVYYLSADSGLVAYYRFDEYENLGIGNAGVDDIRDFSVLANHGDAEGNPQLTPSGIPLDVEEYFNTVSDFILFQNYPNPFNPSTNIGFRISDFGFVSLKVYDVLGIEIATLVNEEKPAGSYEVEFSVSQDSSPDIASRQTPTLSSGVYFYQLKAGSFVETKKMILLR
jgi:hypothetical protein